MGRGKRILLEIIVSLSCIVTYAQTAWTLEDCLRHAEKANITIQKARITEQIGAQELSQAKSALLPSLNFSMSQSLSYRPFQEMGAAMVDNGKATSTSNKVTESGAYGLNAQWTVWNGGQNRYRIKQQELSNRMSELATESSLQTIEERILQYFVQIQYLGEAVTVSRQISETAEKQYARGQDMYEAGKISKADLAQLEAQSASARYDVVNANTQAATTKRQLKELLQIGIDTPFDVQSTPLDDEKAEALIPQALEVYERAIATRPDIQSAEKSIDAADIALKSARGGYWPTIGLQAGIGTNHYTGSETAWGEQMKTNLNGSIGLNISVPIFDNRSNRTSVEKAKLNKATAQLDLADKRQALSNAIEDFYLQAITNQQKFRAACITEKSQRASYELLNEQFACGLKNIVDLLQGRDKVLQASQEKLQSKYTTILAIALLRFYAGEGITL